VTTCFFFWVVADFDSGFLQGFKHYLEAEDPDILIITETKVYRKESLDL
jgi:exonuclease III